MSRYDQEEADKRRLWEHILVLVYGTSDLSQVKPNDRAAADTEGHAFFQVIEMAFAPCDNMNGIVPVHRELVQYMAGWGRETTKGSAEVGGPIGLPTQRNHFVMRGFNGFIQTLRQAIKLNQLRHFKDGRIMYGCFELPTWLIEKYIDEAQDEAEHMNRRWDEDHPGFRDFVREQV